jgi:acetylornithine deacetylase
MARSDQDSQRSRAVAIAEAEVVPLLQSLVALDTQQAFYEEPPFQDAELQELVAAFLGDLGAEVETFEPPPSLFEAHPLALPGQTFAGRPILWAKLPGSSTGQSLLFNGHYDTVPAAPLVEWTHPPLGGKVVDGRLYGRGACDMKGGLAAALAAAAGLVCADVPLPGDILFNLVPFEEANGLGTVATVLSGRRADAAICCEPTKLIPASACRGVMELEIQVEGRASHAEIAQRHHSEGGAVSSIEKVMKVIEALQDLSSQWQTRPDKQHELLAPPRILPTVLTAGTYWATWPGSATASFDVTYLPTDGDASGRGSMVRLEIEQFVATVAANDDWLAGHPPAFRWGSEFPPAELDTADRFGAVVVDCIASVDRLNGVDFWGDHATLINEGKMPTVLLGPGDPELAHAIDENIAIDELRECAALYVDISLAWGSTAA